MTVNDPRETTFDPALSMARQSLYRFAALSLLDPQAGSWEQLHALGRDRLLTEAATLIREHPEACVRRFAKGERHLADLDPQRVFDRLPPSRAALNDEYEQTFGLLVSNACPPYETEYIDSKLSFQRSNTMADVGGFYQAFGLTTSLRHPERPDHVVLELEFMAFLLGLERQASSGDPSQRNDRLEVCRGAQTRFLRDHLAWWIPAFAHLLGKESAGGFYKAVGVFAAALIAAERASLRVPVPTTLAQPTVGQLEECEGCLLNAE
jgi:TorA maturation chaperone TorD